MKPEEMSSEGIAAHLENMTKTVLFEQVPPVARAVFVEAVNRLREYSKSLDTEAIEVYGKSYLVQSEIAELVSNALSVMPEGERWVKSGIEAHCTLSYNTLALRKKVTSGDVEYYKLAPIPKKFEGPRSKAWVFGNPIDKTHPGGCYDLLVKCGESHAVIKHLHGQPTSKDETIIGWCFTGVQEGWE